MNLRDNKNLIAIGALAWIAAAEFDRAPYPWEIEGGTLALTAGLMAAIAGYAAAGKIDALLPDPEGIYIVSFQASDETGGEIWEISQDQFDAMEVHGSLFEWPVSKRVYEVMEYRPEDNVAVGNWRESVAGSQLAGNYDVVDAMAAIEELREEFEPEAQKSRYLQRRLKSIARKIDRQRLKDQEEILDPTLTPSFSDEGRSTVTEIVEESIPSELRPNYDGEAVEEGPETIGFELLDETEALTNGKNGVGSTNE